MRLFIAIDMPEHARAALEDLQDRVPIGDPVDPDTLHLTLAFLDEQSRETAEAVHEVLSDLRVPAFDLALHGLGSFGSKSPKVLWAGVKPCPALTQLRERVRGAARVAGVDLPRERFRPHVTLTRFRHRIEGYELERLRLFMDRFAAAPLPLVRVDEITLFESRLLAKGPRHDALATYPLT